MSDFDPPIVPEPLPASRFPRLAATLSLLAPFVVIFFYLGLFVCLRAFGGIRLTAVAILGLLPFAVIIAGLILGIVALTQTRQQGRAGFFGKAIAGICMNSLLFVLIIALPVLLPRVLTGSLPMTAQGRLETSLKRLASANHEERFYALDDAAKESFNVGHIEDARTYATELLYLAPEYQNNWNYGNAIQDGNLVLGRIAVHEGRIDDAKRFLLAAGNSKGSPQMDSFGPNMSLAKDLLEKGERDMVIQYFGLCRKFWTMDYGKLDEWTQEVKAGEIPDFGANLVY